jgi:hypothetical protein
MTTEQEALRRAAIAARTRRENDWHARQKEQQYEQQQQEQREAEQQERAARVPLRLACPDCGCRLDRRPRLRADGRSAPCRSVLTGSGRRAGAGGESGPAHPPRRV